MTYLSTDWLILVSDKETEKNELFIFVLYEQVPRHQAICKYIINILQRIRI